MTMALRVWSIYQKSLTEPAVIGEAGDWGVLKMEKNEKVTVNIKDNAKKKVNGFWSQTLHCMIQFEDKRNDRK